MINFSEDLNRKAMTISKAEDIMLARSLTKEIAESTGFSEHDSVLLQLVTEEACMNALEHGYSSGQCDFRVTWLVEEGVMEITVCQNGEAFGLNRDVASPMKSSSRGRGLILIKGIMDEVKLIPSESCVTLSMRKSKGV